MCTRVLRGKLGTVKYLYFFFVLKALESLEYDEYTQTIIIEEHIMSPNTKVLVLAHKNSSLLQKGVKARTRRLKLRCNIEYENHHRTLNRTYERRRDQFGMKSHKLPLTYDDNIQPGQQTTTNKKIKKPTKKSLRYHLKLINF